MREYLVEYSFEGLVNMSVWTAEIPLCTSEHPLVLRVLDGSACDWLACEIERCWHRLPGADRRAMARYWRLHSSPRISSVASPLIMAGRSQHDTPHLGQNQQGVAIWYNAEALDAAMSGEHGRELVATAIAHELAHTLHMSQERHIGKQKAEIELEVDALVRAWGFSGDTRSWLEDYFRENRS